MQNVRHVYQIAIDILKFKMTVKFHSQMITNFVWTLTVENTQGYGILQKKSSTKVLAVVVLFYS